MRGAVLLFGFFDKKGCCSLYSGVGSKPHLVVLGVGEARRRGGGTMEAAAKEPPELYGLAGRAALGRVSTQSPHGA
jgi:hypothetical protein